LLCLIRSLDCCAIAARVTAILLLCPSLFRQAIACHDRAMLCHCSVSQCFAVAIPLTSSAYQIPAYPLRSLRSMPFHYSAHQSFGLSLLIYASAWQCIYQHFLSSAPPHKSLLRHICSMDCLCLFRGTSAVRFAFSSKCHSVPLRPKLGFSVPSQGLSLPCRCYSNPRSALAIHWFSVPLLIRAFPRHADLLRRLSYLGRTDPSQRSALLFRFPPM